MKQQEVLIDTYIATFYKMKVMIAAKQTETKPYKKLIKEIEDLWELLDNKSIEAVRKVLTGRPGS
jgi:hypothetical protein